MTRRPIPTRLPVATALAAALLLGAPRSDTAPPSREGEWELHERDGRQYVTASNIARFYGLAGDAILSRGALALTGDRRRLEMMSSDAREIYLNGVRHWLSFPTIDLPADTLISRTDLVKTIEPVLRPERIAGLRPCTAVILDPGHGGADRGARSPHGWEKDYTLDVARRVAPLLERAGVAVILTRATDIDLSLEERAAEAGRRPGSVLVSIHFNAAERNRPDASGLEVFALTPRGAPSTVEDQVDPARAARAPGNDHDAPSMALATCVHRAILRRGTQFDRGVKRARFLVLREAVAPSILVEGGFLSNAHEARMIDSPTWRGELAKAIAVGIFNYQRIRGEHPAPALVAGREPDRETSPAPPPRPSGPGGTITIRPDAN